MKVMLISPPFGASYSEQALASYLPKEEFARYTWLPLGIAYVGAVLGEEGYEVKISDMVAHTWERVESDIKHEDPEVVGISCFTDRRAEAWKVARIARKINPNAKVIMGGPHSTFFPYQTFQQAPIDAVVMGEGEVTTLELLKAIEKGTDLSQVKGIAFRHDTHVFITEPRQFIKDLDSVPFPLYRDFNLRKYEPDHVREEYREFVSCNIITSRGCPFACQYCSTSRYWGRRWRARSPTNIVDEIQMLYDTYDVRNILFFDDNFTLDKKRVIQICKEILARKLDVVWSAQTRVDCVDKDLLQWMAKAGCFEILYGVESGSEKILRNINKGFTVNDIRRAFKLTHEAEIDPIAFLMVGNPGEDSRTIDETIHLIKEIKPALPPSCSITQVFPNTPLYELAKRRGMVSDGYWMIDKPSPYFTVEHTYWELLLLWARLKLGTREKTRCIKWLFTEGSLIFLRHPELIYGSLQGLLPSALKRRSRNDANFLLE